MMSDDQMLAELEKKFSDYRRMLKEQKELSSELIHANKKLTESEALRSHFISSITNEIINPFASILGLSRNLLLLKEGEWEKVRYVSQLIYSEAYSLDFQLKNIFTAANIEAGNIYLEPAEVKVAELIASVIDSFSSEIDKKKIELTVINKMEGDIFITDYEKVRLILCNLISNAIKYNHSEGKVRITSKLNDRLLAITIENTGPGIVCENKEEIFDRFKKNNTEINSINCGHGLGLPVVKSLTELLNGSVILENEDESVCRFVVTIPEISDDGERYPDRDGSVSTIDNEIF